MTRRQLLLLPAALPLLHSCGTPGGGMGETADNGPQVQMRNAAIRAEPRGDWFIGRRYYTHKVRYWGYLRRPGQLWEEAKLVVMDENRGISQPDRLQEIPGGGENAHGYDHNYEYRIWGNFTGRICYDPNSDRELPLFAARKFELISKSPGFLWSPRDRYNPNYIPAREGRFQTPARL
jgi:hypothetical protein